MRATEGKHVRERELEVEKCVGGKETERGRLMVI